MQEQKYFQRLSVFLYIIFILVGIAMIGSAIAFGVLSCNFRRNAEKVTATVTDIRETLDSDGKTHYAVCITYDFGGSTCRDVPLDYQRDTVQIGSTVEIWCSRTDPRDIQSDAAPFAACAALCGSGLVFLALGIVPWIISRKLRARTTNP